MWGGLRYIDDLVLRDRSTANNGTINERRYTMEDNNWNPVAICVFGLRFINLHNRCPTLTTLLASSLTAPFALCRKAGACGILVVRDWLPHFFLQVLNPVSQLSRTFEV